MSFASILLVIPEQKDILTQSFKRLLKINMIELYLLLYSKFSDRPRIKTDTENILCFYKDKKRLRFLMFSIFSLKNHSSYLTN